MSSTLPATMRSLCVASYVSPSKYAISSIPTPKISLPNQVLVKVHAASINPVDVAIASGLFKIATKLQFPLKLGFDLSGTVVAVGGSVKEFKIGDEVFGDLQFKDIGSISEYALTRDEFLVPKPRGLSHNEAASLPLVALTALQSFEQVDGGLEGKTVLVTAGLGGVGSIACQMAKNGFGASRVITTVSTEKLGKVDGLLGKGVVDQVIDYKKSPILTQVPHGSVDVVLDNTSEAMSLLPILSKGKGTIISIHGTSGRDVKSIIPETPTLLQMVLNMRDSYYRFRIESRGGFQYKTVLQAPTKAGLQRIAKWAEEGKLKPVVGKTLKLEDIHGLREAFTQISSGKGSLGKVVVEIN